MATKAVPTKAVERPQQDAGKRLLEWIEQHQRTVIVAAIALAAAAGAVWFYVEYRERREVAAMRALDQARASLQAGNLPLASSDLSRLISTYGGAGAADEAVMLLARVRMTQGQPAIAAAELRAGIAKGLGDQFRAPAYALLGAALEDTGDARGAAEAYRQAVEASWYAHLKARYLNDAGRALTAAGDTAGAARAYERLLNDFGETPSAVEARIRLSELRPRASAGS